MRKCGNAEDMKKTQKERKANAPRKLPPERPRSLTCPLPTRQRRSWNPFMSSVQQTFDQSQCALFTKLPSEVRLQIWSEVLGGHLLHIARAPKKLLAIPCGEEHGSKLPTWAHSCWGISGSISLGPTPGFYLGDEGPGAAKPVSLLPLLRTCRKVYTESILILYGENIFDINHIDTPIYLRQSVLPQRLGQILRVNFTWDFKYATGLARAPYDLGTWRETCNVLASLTGLRELSMHLSGYDLTPGADKKGNWGPLLEALVQIKPAKKFHVFLPWSENHCAAAEEGYPFRLMSMVDPHQEP